LTTKVNTAGFVFPDNLDENSYFVYNNNQTFVNFDGRRTGNNNYHHPDLVPESRKVRRSSDIIILLYRSLLDEFEFDQSSAQFARNAKK
jgi:hypothetical protein